MSDVLTRDADALHRALDGAGDEVEVSISRQTAEWLTRIVDARSRGQRVIITPGTRRGQPHGGSCATRRFASASAQVHG